MGGSYAQGWSAGRPWAYTRSTSPGVCCQKRERTHESLARPLPRRRALRYGRLLPRRLGFVEERMRSEGMAVSVVSSGCAQRAGAGDGRGGRVRPGPAIWRLVAGIPQRGMRSGRGQRPAAGMRRAREKQVLRHGEMAAGKGQAGVSPSIAKFDLRPRQLHAIAPFLPPPVPSDWAVATKQVGPDIASASDVWKSCPVVGQ